MKVLINKKGDKFYVDGTKDYSFNHGFIKKEQFKKGKLKTNKGVEFYSFDADFADDFYKLPRPTQIEQPKDIVAIMAEVPLDKKSVVVDAGLGSGGFSIFVSRYVKKIYAFEKEKKHYDAAVKNLKKFGVKNVDATLKNINKGIPVKNADLIHLDLPEPWFAMKPCALSLKKGGYLVCYLPSISQIQKVVGVAEKFGFFVLKIKEVLEREWVIDDLKSRPKHTMLGHTAFIVVMRKFE